MSAISRLLILRPATLVRKAAVGLGLTLLTVATSTSSASAACNPPKFASTYNPATGEAVYWVTRITDPWASVQGRIWSGTTDHTGTCNDGAQTFWEFAVNPGTIGLSISLGNACVPGCPSGSLTTEAVVTSYDGTDRQILMVKVPETPLGGANFDYSTTAYHLCDPPRPVITDLNSNGTTKLASVSIGSMTACAFGGALQDITGWNVLSKASSTDPGVFGSYGLRGSFAVTPGSDGSASGTIQLDCSNPALDQWVTAQLVTVAPVHHVFGPTTRVSCRTGSASCSGMPEGTVCDDGDPGTVHDTCHLGNCIPGCADGSACTDFDACTANDTCMSGTCTGTPVVCDDGNPCTTDVCDHTTGCMSTNNTATCSDGNACTTGDTCGGGSCHPGPPTNCDDGNACTTDVCQPASGCGHTALPDGAACTDAAPCSVGDSCHAGVCQAPASFSPAAGSPVSLGTKPSSAASGDFNRDGLPDLAVANQTSNNVSILLGNGAGGFTAAAGSPFSVGSSPRSVATADLDNDGILDLVVANQLGNDLTVLRGNGSGGFLPAPSSPVAAGAQPVSVVIGDFTRNGRLDLAVVNDGPNSVTIFDQDAAGSFSPIGLPIPVGTHPAYVAAGDLNGDGTLDLAVANFSSHDVSILLGDGAGGVTPSPGSPVHSGGISPTSIVLGDLNGDGALDLALANSVSNDVSILLGNGSGQFNLIGSIGVGATPLSIAAGDLNGDGRLDLVVANSSSNDVTVLLGQGSGGFALMAGSPIAMGLRPVFAGLVDLNEDGKLDLAVVNSDSNKVAALMNGTIGRPNGGACDDGSSCTINDACFNDSCVGTPSGCASQCMMPAPGLTGWWPGEGLANDISGTGNNGIFTNSARFTSGIVGQAFRFYDGISDVSIPYSASLVPGAGSFSVAAWIRPYCCGGGIIVSMNECGNSTCPLDARSLYELSSYFHDAEFALRDASGTSNQRITNNANVQDGGWHLVVATRDMAAHTVNLYVDNGPPSSAVLGTSADGLIQDATQAPVIIGAEVYYGDYYRGDIDEVMYANRAFTPSEVQALYAARGFGLCRCVDEDGDGYGAQGGVSCPNGTQQDCNDSAGQDGVWSAPIEVRNLKLGRALVDTAIRWDSQAVTVGPDVTYDVIRGDLSSLAAGYSGSCIGSGIAIATMTDPTAPSAGSGFWYLVRGHDTCGLGSYGNQGIHGVTGAERVTSVVCP